MNGHLDRTGEPIEDEEPDVEETAVEPEPVHDRRCVFGWIDREEMIPCLDCKPWLAPEALRQKLYGVDPGPKEAQ